jgi:hypothetical protein
LVGTGPGFYQDWKMKKISKKQMLILSLLPGGLTLTRLFSMSPDLIEKHYSQGLYHLLARALGYISQCLPLSLAEVLVSMAVLGLLGGLIKQGLNISKGTLALKAALKKDALFLVAVFSLGYFLFLLLWGFNYYRLPLAELMGLDTTHIRAEELESLCMQLIQESNELRMALPEDSEGVVMGDKREVLRKAGEGFAQLAGTYQELGGNYTKPKALIMSELLSHLALSGIYFPFTAEANVNMGIPTPLFPATVAHEMAHQKGFAREDEANYIAYLSCRQHPDPYHQYSGSLLALINAMNALARLDYEQYQDLQLGYAAGVRRDLAAISQYWQQYKGPMARTSARVKDAYLQFNGQEEGINTYGRMVDLLIGERRLSVPQILEDGGKDSRK